MKHRLPLALAAAALLVALLGATSLGQAATTGVKKTATAMKLATSPATLRAQKARGPRGPRGPRGRRGPRGPAGPAGIATLAAVDGPAAVQCANGGGGCQVATSTAVCPAGSYVVGGGHTASTPDNVVAYARRVNATSYGVIAVNFWPTSATIAAHAVCAAGAGIQPLSLSTGSQRELTAELAELRAALVNR